MQAPKAPRPQQAYYSAPVVEKRKPAFAPSPAPQYYDYEEEIPTTQRPVQIQRPKYSIPSQPPQPRPQQPVSSDYEYSFTPVQSAAKSFAPQYQQYENRQPVQFPAETEAPTAAAPSRADDFALFSPAARADFNKPQVRAIRVVKRIRLRRVLSPRRKRNQSYFIIKKKRRFND